MNVPLLESLSPAPLQLQQDLQAAGAEVYQELISRDGHVSGYTMDNIHTRRVCDRFTLGVKIKLANDYTISWLNGYPGPTPDLDMERQLAWKHQIGLVKSNKLVFDGTWQQFIRPDQRTVHMPRILLGTTTAVFQRVQDYGITDPAILNYYISAFSRI